ncbi:MAG: DUF805 domain-containing protein [Pseudomonadota bacterium]|nr:DUF805 domain-containing protein [Pseudomonadota bacterium]
MLGSIVWITGRNTRIKWWTIQLVYGCFIGFIWMNFAPTGAFVLLANDVAQNRAEMARETAMLGNLEKLNTFVTYAAIPIWWIIIVNNIRRYHDVNKSGWWAINTFIPFFGNIWQILQIGFTPGTRGPNDYGPPPGSATGQSFDSDDAPSAGGVLSKVDDAYLAEYARRHAAEQVAKSSTVSISANPQTLSPNSVGGGSFGRRR